MERHVVLFDADCGICTRAVSSLRALDGDRRLRYVPIVSTDGDELLAELTPATRLESFHLVAPDGTLRSGADALPTLLKLVPALRVLGSLGAAFPGPTRAVYDWVARNRGTLSRLVGAERCDV